MFGLDTVHKVEFDQIYFENIAQVQVLTIQVEEEPLVQKVPQRDEALHLGALQVREHCLHELRHLEPLRTVLALFGLQALKGTGEAPVDQILPHHAVRGEQVDVHLKLLRVRSNS